LPLNKRKPRALVLRGEITTPLGRRDVTTLVDTRGEENFISQSFIKDAQIPEPDQAPTIVYTINGHQIPSYSIHALDLSLADSTRRK
jgi:hypothetical protein